MQKNYSSTTSIPGGPTLALDVNDELVQKQLNYL
jgi:hypothetical protein